MLFLMLSLFACGEAEVEEPAEETEEEVKEEKPEKKPGKGGGGAEDADCNTTGYSLKGAVGDSVMVKCPADCTSGSVWGDDRYTPDSKICTAAIHTGAIGKEGGKVKVFFKEKFGPFEGSKKNGIESRDWTTPYEPSITIKGKKNK